MACPSGEFAKMVRTSTGLTVENPYTLVPNYLAYAEWLAQAQLLLARTRREYRQYSEVKPPESWTSSMMATWETLGKEFDEIVERYNELPAPWDLTDISFPGELITRAAGLTQDVACLWERISAEVKKIGGKPIDPPGKSPTSMTLLSKVLIVGGVALGAGGLVYAAHSYQNKKET